MRLVQAQQSDLDSVRAIDASAGPYPWPETALIESIQSGDLYLASLESIITGFLVSQSVLDETTLMHLAVSAELQRQGVARQMLQRWISRERAAGQRRLLLEVRRSNQPAATLYQSLGFEPIGERRRYYQVSKGHEDGQTSKGHEDALVMAFVF
jgi:ribosomal-protein-alanine N-acetyltransferase